MNRPAHQRRQAHKRRKALGRALFATRAFSRTYKKAYDSARKRGLKLPRLRVPKYLRQHERLILGALR